MQAYIANMRVAKLSEVTIHARVEALHRLAQYLDVPLLEATMADLYRYQVSYSHLSPATVDNYTRHVKAFYAWARRAGHIDVDPAENLVLPIVHKGRPHPTSRDDLQVIFACTSGYLRTVYVLAAFAGLRCGEIARLQHRDLDLDATPTALIHGKGGRERTIPLLAPVVAEIGWGRGYVVELPNGKPISPRRLSVESSKHLTGLGLPTTLHGLRHAFATSAVKITHDPLLVRDLLGHASVQTTEIYMQSSMAGAHDRLASMASVADGLLRPRHLAAVSGA